MTSRRLVSSLGLAVPVITRLLDADITYEDDLREFTPSDLCSATGLSLKECAEVCRVSSGNSVITSPTTVLQMIKNESEATHIVSFCEALDDLLGGGFPLQSVTEIFGTPGIGKTQICLQLCVSAQVPEDAGGIGGEAVFVDTEGSFTVSRLQDMAKDAENHIKSVIQEAPSELAFSSESVLKGTHYFRCHSYIEILAVIKHMPKFFQSRPKIRLLIIDSVAFHFRHDFSDMRVRMGILYSLSQELIQLATEYNIAVVLTNQMTTRIQYDGSSELVAALGETWGHCPTLRLQLYWLNNIRTAKLVKAPHKANNFVTYQVTSGGIRDCDPKSSLVGEAYSADTHSRKRRHSDSI